MRSNTERKFYTTHRIELKTKIIRSIYTYRTMFYDKKKKKNQQLCVNTIIINGNTIHLYALPKYYYCYACMNGF